MIKSVAMGEVPVELPADGTALDVASPVGDFEQADGLQARYFTRTTLAGL